MTTFPNGATPTAHRFRYSSFAYLFRYGIVGPASRDALIGLPNAEQAWVQQSMHLQLCAICCTNNVEGAFCTFLIECQPRCVAVLQVLTGRREAQQTRVASHQGTDERVHAKDKGNKLEADPKGKPKARPYVCLRPSGFDVFSVSFFIRTDIVGT